MSKALRFSKISLVITALVTSYAWGAGFQVNELSPTIQATALSDAATATGDISGMGYNPALLATTDGTNVYAGASAIIPEISYENANVQLSPDLGPNITPTGLTSENDISPTVLVPALYIGTEIPYHPDVKVGIGMNVPYGLSTEYDQNSVVRYNALDSTVKTVDILPTIAVNATQKLALGASLNIEQLTANLSNDFMQGLDISTINGSSILNGSSWGVGATVGLTYNITPRTTFGADYHSSVRETIDGTATIASNCEGNAGLCNTLIADGRVPNGDYPANTTIRLPGVVNLGLSQQVTDRLDLMAGAEWTEWSSVKGIFVDIPGIGEDNTVLNYTNSWLYSIGASYMLTPRLKLMSGLAFDETPTVNEYRDARLPDSNRQWLTLGADYAMTKNFNVFGTYEHIFMNNQSIYETDYTPNAAPATVSANYNGYANIIAAGVNYKF